MRCLLAYFMDKTQGECIKITVFDKVPMVQEGAQWPNVMIRLGPHWHKVN